LLRLRLNGRSCRSARRMVRAGEGEPDDDNDGAADADADADADAAVPVAEPVLA